MLVNQEKDDQQTPASKKDSTFFPRLPRGLYQRLQRLTTIGEVVSYLVSLDVSLSMNEKVSVSVATTGSVSGRQRLL